MRPFLILAIFTVATCAAAMTACSDADEAAPATVSSSRSAVPTEALSPPPTRTTHPTSAPTFVVTGIPSAMPVTDAAFDEFRTFSRRIDAAARTGDSRFFANRGIEYLTVCQERDTTAECVGQPAGTRFEGIYDFDSLTGTVQMLQRDEFARMLDDWWDTALPAESDENGAGGPRVVGIARWDGFEALAVVSLIAETGTGIQRQARIFRFILAGEWVLHVERFLPASDLVTRWLSGTCAECYDYWEPWQGATE